jgi:hypothetical protein
MAEFNSPIGKRNIQNNNREYKIPDETGSQRNLEAPVFDQRDMQDFNNRMSPAPAPYQSGELEREIQEQKKLKREGRDRLSEGARRRVEILVGMSRISREFDIGGYKYKLQSLTSKELREAIVGAAEFDGTVQLVFETRKQLLARSLIVVAGTDINDFLSSNDIKTKLDFIEELDHSLLLRIYNEYTLLVNEVNEKYTLKTEEEAKEVLEDLKK